MGMEPNVLTTGELLGDRYRLEEPIAEGGMGHVWRATDTVLSRGVAVKVLHAHVADDPGFALRFRDEARTMAALRHPGVADVYDYGVSEHAQVAYLVMAYVDGEPLIDRIAAAGRLDPAETLSMVAQAAAALHAVHRAGVVHRDVKPGNLIRQADGTVVLVDFGVARSADSARLTAVNEVVGTALYMAPEQVSKQPITPATDIYALGAVAYHCLAGHPPFLGDNPLDIALRHLNDSPSPLPADVPQPLRDLVARAMAKDPADRFPSAAAMAEAASGLPGAGLAGDYGPHTAVDLTVPVGDAPVTEPVPGPVTPSDRRRTVALWTALLVALAALGIAFALAGPDGLFPGPGDTPTSPQPGGTVPGGGPGGSPGTAPGPGGNPTGSPGSGENPPTTGPTEPEPSSEPSPEPSTEPQPEPTQGGATGSPAAATDAPAASDAPAAVTPGTGDD